MTGVLLSVLDLARVREGATLADAMQDAIGLAQHAESVGATRFWVAEHHNMPGVASSAPAVLIGAVAAATSRIRVGSGGVMLPNHAPLVVAEQFGTLDALHPGRIDLGIGRAPGTDAMTIHALRGTNAPPSDDELTQQLALLRAFLAGSFPADHPYRAVTAVPGLGADVAIWLLGSSGYSAQVAGLLGLPFAFAHHFSPDNTIPALRLYRERFAPGALDEPHAAVAVSVVAADDDEHARFLAGPSTLSFRRLRAGRPGRIASPADAARALADEPEPPRSLPQGRRGIIVGGPTTVRAGLAELLEETGAQELLVTLPMFDQADRLRALDIVAAELPAAQAEVAGAR